MQIQTWKHEIAEKCHVSSDSGLKCSQNALKKLSKCFQKFLEMLLTCSQNALKMLSKCFQKSSKCFQLKKCPPIVSNVFRIATHCYPECPSTLFSQSPLQSDKCRGPPRRRIFGFRWSPLIWNCLCHGTPPKCMFKSMKHAAICTLVAVFQKFKHHIWWYQAPPN